MAWIKDYAYGMRSTDWSPYYKTKDLSEVRPSMFHEKSSHHCIITWEYKPPYWGFWTHWETGFAISAKPFISALKNTDSVGMNEFAPIGDAIIWCCIDMKISEEDCLKLTEQIFQSIRNRVKELVPKMLGKITDMKFIDSCIVDPNPLFFDIKRKQDAYE